MKLAAAVPNRILLATYARCIPATYLLVSRASRAAPPRCTSPDEPLATRHAKCSFAAQHIDRVALSSDRNSALRSEKQQMKQCRRFADIEAVARPLPG
jgi:hypothetical protein